MNTPFLNSMDSLEIVFWICALFGTIFFVFRVIMMTTGGDSADHAVLDQDVPSDAAFEIISVNSITAFFMMFGWIGLTCYKQFVLGQAVSILTAFVVGVLCMMLTAYLFKLAKKLVSQGSVYSIKDTVGLTASVYQRIIKDGRGKISITVGDLLREIEAVSEDKVDIDSFKTVTVVRVVDPGTVSVREVK